MSSRKFVIKVLVAGTGGVGKTTLLHKVTTGEFLEDTSMTIGVQFHLLSCRLGDSVVVLQLWDFAGQERFRFFLDTYVKGAKGAVLMYDVSRLQTMDGLDDWIKIVRGQDPNLPILFVGSKMDLGRIMVDDEYVAEKMRELNLFGHYRCSSKTDVGIKAVFENLTREIVRLNDFNVGGDLNDFEILGGSAG
jgi:small GTP-binding protein